jgi:hypothetical protein
MSIGWPRLVAKPINRHKTSANDDSPNDLNKMFYFADHHFSVFFEMLTDEDRDVLVKEVKHVRQIDVSPSSFLNLMPKSVTCKTKGTSSRIKFECTLNAGSETRRKNQFTLSTQQSSDLKLVDKLFGNGSETFVTRNQLTTLANEVNNYFSVVEEYQIPEDRFPEDFVNNIISLTGDGFFKDVSFDQAIQRLSKYAFNYENDLRSNEFKKEISNMLKVETVANKSFIKFDKKENLHMDNSTNRHIKQTLGLPLKNSLFIDLNINGAFDFVSNRESK